MLYLYIDDRSSILWFKAKSTSILEYESDDPIVYDNLKRGQIIIKKGATAEVAKLTK